MRALFRIVGTTVGSMAGWALGSRLGFAAGCFTSVLGMGVGLYLGTRFWEELDRYLG